MSSVSILVASAPVVYQVAVATGPVVSATNELSMLMLRSLLSLIATILSLMFLKGTLFSS